MRKISALLLAAILVLVATLPAQAGNRLAVYYAGPEGSVRTALTLGNMFTLVEDPAQADVLVLNDVIPAGAETLTRRGTGLVLILGPDLTADQVSDLTGVPLKLTRTDQAISIADAPGASDGLLKDIVWNSAPQVRERFQVTTPDSRVKPLVSRFEDGEWVLWSIPRETGETLVFNAFLDGANPQIQEWAYYNYFIYSLVVRAAGQQPLSFADYPASPVPHKAERTVLMTAMGGLILLAGLAFFLVRRYSLAHPEALDVLVSGREAYESRQAHTDWEEVGFHRPLGGFMLAFMLGLVLFIPLIIYQSLILPTYILPSAQALGIWGRVTQFFNLLWTFFDMGTGLAFVKFFSQYRVNDPKKAIKYGQVFVWWQALSGAIQVTLVVLLSSLYLPKTAYALYSWSIIIHACIQIPGWFALIKNGFRGWQRFDYAQILDLASGVIIGMFTQPALVLLMTAWGRSHPAFGQAMGGLMGMGLAAYATEAFSFIWGLFLYHRLGYNTRLLFLAHFDWETVKKSFRFGVFDMLGSSAWAIGQAVEILITQTRLVNYNEIWGNWGMAQNFIYAFSVTATLYDNLMPAISESISNAYRKLSQYYSAMAYKWGGLTNGFIASVLLAVTDRFILGATGVEFERAAVYAIPLILWGAIQYPSWVGDNVQIGSNHPYLKTILVAGEQCIRIILAFLLIRRFQINGLIIAYFVGLLSKDFVAYFINHRVCYPQRFYFWQSLGAPVLAGAAHYAIVRTVTGWIWRGDQVTSVLIFLIGILLSYPIYAFLYGLAGGWDDGTLEELQHAARLSSFMRPLAWFFWYMSRLGAQVSPLHNRFPISIRQEAMAEAALLTAQRVQITREVPPVKPMPEEIAPLTTNHLQIPPVPPLPPVTD